MFCIFGVALSLCLSECLAAFFLFPFLLSFNILSSSHKVFTSLLFLRGILCHPFGPCFFVLEKAVQHSWHPATASSYLNLAFYFYLKLFIAGYLIFMPFSFYRIFWFAYLCKIILCVAQYFWKEFNGKLLLRAMS